MDEREIKDWRNFCEGNSPYTPDHFSSLFMELYLKPFTKKDKDDLHSIFSLVPNATCVLEKLLRLDDPAHSKSNEEIKDLVAQDLCEMRRILKSGELLAAIEYGVTEIILEEGRFRQACDCELNRLFYHELADFFVKEMGQHDGRIRALSNAFYGLGNNIHLQWALTADLLHVDVNCANYFELYLIGVDYAVCEDGVVVMDYRAKNTAS
jgi:hypothetical protein